MAHPFEVADEITVGARPEDVWHALTNGPAMDSWFMGHSEVDPRPGGAIRSDVGSFVIESTITAWEPMRHLKYESAAGPDGHPMAFEYTIEARGGGQTTIRFVHSGFLSGDEWESEYDALKKGDPAYLHKLGAYLTHFNGRISVKNIFAPGPEATDKLLVWSRVHAALGLRNGVALGDTVRAAPTGLAPIDGVVDYVSDDFLGVRTADGLIRVIHGWPGAMVTEQHIFSDAVARQSSTEAWQRWMTDLLA